jgi:hypothetical protein
MHFKRVLMLVLLLFAFSDHVFGQASLPWLRPEQRRGQEAEEVSESQLPLVRARIEGSSEVWVGQAIPLNVEVIVPSWFAGAPKFSELEVPNALTLNPEGAVNFVVQSGGKTFSAQGQRYLIFPQVRGKYTVPSAKVEVTYAMPDGKPSAPAILASPPIQFEARLPAGAEGAKYYLTTSNFRINQSLDRKLEGLKVGDSFTRTVDMTAEDTVGISLPPLTFEARAGIRLYPGTPKVSEKAERGKIEATRTETATYVLEREGRYTLPEIAIVWWNPQTKRMNKARLPAIELQVQANSGYNTEVFARSQEPEEKPVEEPGRTGMEHLKASLHWLGLLLGVFLLLLVLWRILNKKGISIKSYFQEIRKRRAEAEITYFKRFRKASLSNDTKATLRELMFWLDRTNTRPVAPTLEQFERESGIPELSKEGEALKDLLFARSAELGPMELQKKWSGKPFYRLVAKARKAQIQRNKGPKRRGGEQIISLNPHARFFSSSVETENLKSWTKRKTN